MNNDIVDALRTSVKVAGFVNGQTVLAAADYIEELEAKLAEFEASPNWIKTE